MPVLTTDKKRVVTILLPVLLALAAPAASQKADCAILLRGAERSHGEGRLEEARQRLQECLEAEATDPQKAHVHALLAKIWIDEDDEESAKAEVRILIDLEPGFTASPTDPRRFIEYVEDEKHRRSAKTVSSVSKVDEPLREAPATVIVVTAEEIERRGYLDLEELLHDLPGFDISRGNGDVYSNIYMRGYRSDRSDRMLLIIDGVEQNDLHSNAVYLSRQYPLSNVDRVEVVYGPASTIYGANAFTGVISITTKAPAAFLEKDSRLGTAVEVGGGSFGTSFLDATVAGQTANGRLRWSLTGRSYRSDEQDLAGFDDWDYDDSVLDELDYQEVMRLGGALGLALVPVCEEFPEECQVVREGGEIVAIEPTVFGAELARDLDKQLFAVLQDRSLAYSDETDDWAVDAKLQFGALTLGLQTWRREEGTASWYTDFLRGTGSAWTPEQTNVYVRYAHPLSANLRMALFSRFKSHQVGGSSSSYFVTFANRNLNIFDLIFISPPTLSEISFSQKSTQFRNELTFVYEPSEAFNLVSGIEARNSSLQPDFKTAALDQVRPDDFGPEVSFFDIQISTAKIETTDLGVFVQASYKPREDFKIVAGGRLDTNSIRRDEVFRTLDFFPLGEHSPEACDLFKLGPFPCDLETTRLPEIEDSGTVFNPRLAFVYTPGDFVFKAIYAEAFKDPSSFQKLTREPGIRNFISPDLKPERVRNTEFSFSWQSGEEISVDFAAYQADYTDAVALKNTINPAILEDPFAIIDESFITNGQFENLGSLRIRGAQINARYRFEIFDLFGNYTYTEPFNTEPTDELGQPLLGIDEKRIGDIASHRLNLGANLAFGERWNVNLRANWVDDRRTGATTTVVDNPFDEIDSYFVANSALSYKGFPAGATWQLVVRNLFDAEYFHPGVQRAGAGFASRLPQPGRTVFVRLVYKR